MENQVKCIFGEPNLFRQNKAVIFPVKYGGEIYKCVVSSELLKDFFNASESNLLETYKNNKAQINEVAKNLIISGDITLDDEVLITTEVFKS